MATKLQILRTLSYCRYIRIMWISATVKTTTCQHAYVNSRYLIVYFVAFPCHVWSDTKNPYIPLSSILFRDIRVGRLIYKVIAVYASASKDK